MTVETAPRIIGERPADYAGDISVEEAWRTLETDESAVLVDVRTGAEWSFVGVPDLSGLDKKPLLIEWQQFPGMQLNPSFIDQLSAHLTKDGANKDRTVLFICRSGARSRSAAVALTAAGFTACHNVAGGFEGDLDGEQHRGILNGWKAAGLAWVQS